MKKTSLLLSQARERRRQGVFIRTFTHLYQDVDTKDFWKINKESGRVERIFLEKQAFSNSYLQNFFGAYTVDDKEIWKIDGKNVVRIANEVSEG